jgi:hypothetical protein
MAEQRPPPTQFTPRFRTDVYPFIHPAKFRGSLQDKVAIITGMYTYHKYCYHSSLITIPTSLHPVPPSSPKPVKPDLN